jgi:hypothetical protein
MSLIVLLLLLLLPLWYVALAYIVKVWEPAAKLARTVFPSVAFAGCPSML